MFGVDPEIGTSALRLWVAGSAALLLAICVVVWLRQSSVMAHPALRIGSLIIGVGVGAAGTWAFLDRAGVAEQAMQRRVLQSRAQDLNARTLAPGSPLACLDSVAGESVAAACERALFASPASVAAASSYAAARLTLLSDMVAYAGRGGAGIENTLLPLRRSLEVDSFGFVAHVLATRDRCTNRDCKALTLLHDASRVGANLSAETFDRYLEHYLALWAKAPDGALADATQTGAIPQGPRKVTVNADFPSAASIPAVSIMNPEPTGPVLPGVAAAAAANPNVRPGAAPSPRHSRKEIATPVAPSAPSSAAAEPIWPEPVPPSPQAAAAPSRAGPIEPSPVAPPSNASAGMNVRSQ